MRIGEPGNDAEIDRHRPAQPHPGGEGCLTQVEPERQQTEEHGHRPSQQDQHGGPDNRTRLIGRQLFRRHQQAEHQEQHDLREPGHALEEVLDVLVRAMLRRTDDHRGQVGREKAAGADELSQPEDGEATG